MAIPLSYNLRNLIVRKTTTLMTAAGIAMTVAVLLAVVGLNVGLRKAFAAQGDPTHLLLLRKGGSSELTSEFTPKQLQTVKGFPGIRQSASGQPMVSMEVVTIITLNTNGSQDDGNSIAVRGLAPVGIEMRHLKLQSGRWFKPSLREVVTGKNIAKRYPQARVGRKLRFGRGDWLVVGVLDGGDSAVNSEIFADGNQVASDYNRMDAYSSALVQTTDEVTAAALVKSFEADRRLNVTALSERDYYALQTVSSAPVSFLGGFVCIIMAIGSAFAAMNTMYAAVARRSKDIGTLRVLGFTKGSILLSFLIESVVLSMLGGILACVVVLPLNGLTTGIGNFITFSETSFNFYIGPTVMLMGIAFAGILGALGGFLPARQAARKEILTALRQA